MNFKKEVVNKLLKSNNLLEKVDYRQEELIVERHLKGNRPCVITGLADKWSARNWTMGYIKELCGEVEMVVRRYNYDTLKIEDKKIRVADYIDYVIQNEEDPDKNPYYANGNLNPPPELWADYDIPDYLRCNFDNFRTDPEKMTFSWIFIAPKYGLTRLHTDIIHSFNWNLVITGKKLWVYYPDDQVPYINHGLVNPFAPDLELNPDFKETDPITYVQSPGEIVFTPSPWWHAVLNLEMGVSLTENFINQYDIKNVKDYCVENDIPTPELV